jgi:serine/threonine protein kinase
MDPSIGTVVDRYTIEAPLGRGGQAIVYRARHNQLGTLHAIKVLQMPTASVRKRLIQEGQVQARLKHPNIVAVSDVIDVGGAPGLVMEYVEGPSMDVLLARHRLTVEQIDDLALGVLAGVAAAHRQGLVHRDLKPHNIMLQVTPGGFIPKVMDFGLAKVLSGDTAPGHRTRTGAVMGTPFYMSPEQIRETKNVDQRTDVFALGCVLYEMVTGVRAFEREDILATYSAIAAGDYVKVSARIPAVPERMERAIDGALRPDMSARLQSVDALIAVWTGKDAAAGAVAASLWSTDLLAVRAPTEDRDATDSVTSDSDTWSTDDQGLPSDGAHSAPTLDPSARGVDEVPAGRKPTPLVTVMAEPPAAKKAEMAPAIGMPGPEPPPRRRVGLWLAAGSAVAVAAVAASAGAVGVAWGSGLFETAPALPALSDADSKRLVEAAVAAKLPDVEQCETAARGRAPDVAGTVTIAWSIARGAVTSAVVADNTTGDAELSGCIRGVVASISVDPRISADTSYPFVLEPPVPARSGPGVIMLAETAEMAGGQEAIDACIGAASGRKHAGAITLTWTVTRGVASDVETKVDSTGDAALAGCLAAAVRGTPFPSGISGPMYREWTVEAKKSAPVAAPPPPRLSDADTIRLIREAVAGAAPKFNACADQAKARSAGVSGTVAVAWEFESGTAHDARAATNTTGDDELGRCAAGVAASLVVDPRITQDVQKTVITIERSFVAPPPPAIPGTVTVSCVPFCDAVTIAGTAGTRAGRSGAFTGSVPPGSAKVALHSSDGRDATASVTVVSEQEVKLCWDFDAGAPCN